MLAIAEASVVAITVAGIAAFGSVIAAVFSARLGRDVKATKEAVGTPNGQGDLVAMAEKLLRGQTGQDMRLASLERRTGGVEAGIVDLGARVQTIEQAIDTKEKPL